MTPSKNVTVVEHGSKRLFIIGTAHVSARSVEEVRRTIDEVRPDTVCVELDQTRYDAIVDDSRWRNLDIFSVIRQRKVLFLLTTVVLSAYQRKLGEKLGVRPGAELLAGVEKAKEQGATLVLADRDIQATLKRTWRNLSFLNRLKLLFAMVTAVFTTQDIDEEQIERLKDRDNIGEMMRELAEVMPELQVPLIDERDRFLMSMIQEAPGQTIVAVVGAGHVQGMLGYLGQSADREALSRIPPPSRVTTALKWLLPLAVVALIAYWVTTRPPAAIGEMVTAWVVPNVLLAALAALLVRASWPTVIVAGLASPITSLLPVLRAGMFAGATEAYLKRPTVADCERIGEDAMSLRGLLKNPFTHVLITFIAVNVGSTLGAAAGGLWIFLMELAGSAPAN